MATFMVTIGQKYRREPHPHSAATPDGWFRVDAETEEMARAITVVHFGQQWSGIYPAEVFEDHKHYYPLGEIDVLGRPDR